MTDDAVLRATLRGGHTPFAGGSGYQHLPRGGCVDEHELEQFVERFKSAVTFARAIEIMEEGIEADEGSLRLIARKGDGALRDAFSTFDYRSDHVTYGAYPSNRSPGYSQCP